LDLDGDGILDSFWRGDVDCLERIYRQQRKALERIAARYVGAAEAESVIQDVFVELIRSEEVRRRVTGGSLAAWLSEVTRRKALEHLRRTGRAAPGEGSAPPAYAPESGLLARELVGRFVEREVPEGQRRFFVLRFLERRTQVEVADELRVPRSTLEGWEHRLAEKLRRFIVEGA
jgi:RNA polymerase sigma factor (sigma-70 family)